MRSWSHTSRRRLIPFGPVTSWQAVIHPGLLTRHWMDLTTFLFAQPDGGLLRTGLLVQLAWVAIFGSLAWARVTSANITA